METLKALSLRKSVRAYKPEQITDEILNLIIKAGFQAPVATCKYDSLHITIVQNPVIMEKVINATSDLVFKMLNIRKNVDFGAKTLIIVSSTPAIMPGIDYANAACVLENMVIAATDQGVDSLIWGGTATAVNQNDTLKKLLEIPDGFNSLLCASFGYATKSEYSKEHSININRI